MAYEYGREYQRQWRRQQSAQRARKGQLSKIDT
jgi:hypothetical protein